MGIVSKNNGATTDSCKLYPPEVCVMLKLWKSRKSVICFFYEAFIVYCNYFSY